MAYGVVRTDNLYGTDVRAALVSVKYMGSNGETPTAIENGNILKVGALIEGEREVYIGGKVAAEDKLSDVVLIASPEVMYDDRHKNLNEFINEAGKISRGYRLHAGSGETFGVTKDCLAGKESPVKGDIIELAAGTKLNVADEATPGSTVVGKIIAVENASGYTFYVVKVD